MKFDRNDFTDPSQVLVVNTDTFEPMGTIGPVNGLVRSASFSPDGKRIAVGMQSGDVTIWNIETSQLEQRIDFGTVCCMTAFSQDGTRLFLGTMFPKIEVYHVESGRKLKSIPEGGIYQLAISAEAIL